MWKVYDTAMNCFVYDTGMKWKVYDTAMKCFVYDTGMKWKVDNTAMKGKVYDTAMKWKFMIRPWNESSWLGHEMKGHLNSDNYSTSMQKVDNEFVNILKFNFFFLFCILNMANSCV